MVGDIYKHFWVEYYMFYLQITLDWEEAVRESERTQKLESESCSPDENKEEEFTRANETV